MKGLEEERGSTYMIELLPQVQETSNDTAQCVHQGSV